MTLKSKTRVFLGAFVVLHVVVFAILSGAFDASEMGEAKMLEQPLTAFGAGAFLIVFVLQSIVPANAKHSMVFWRLSDPLPGSRAFTDLMHDDPRIDVESLKRKHGELPTDPADQNRLWYRLYKNVEDKQSVASSHYDFLLARDLTALSLIFALVLPIPFLLVGGPPKLYGWYFLALTGLYLMLRLVGVRTGERFVATVLAEDSVSDSV